jgi:small subunit ribosomal protein S20
MANIKSAKKRIKVIETKTQRNKRVKSHLKEILKDFEAALAGGDQKTARDKLALAEKKLLQAAAKGTVHKNSASRKVARLTASFAKAFGSEALLDKAGATSAPKKEKKAAPAKKKAAPVAEEIPAEEVIVEETPDTEEEIPEVADAEAEAEADAAETEEIAPDTEEEAVTLEEAVKDEEKTEA